MDLVLSRELLGLQWMIDKATYELMSEVRHARISDELPEAVQLSVWRGFEHLGDGLHPDTRSVRHAAKRIARFIKINEWYDAQK